MVDRPRVVLLGNSLLMDGVAVSLAKAEMPGLERLAMECSDVLACLQAAKPDLILFELDYLPAQWTASLLRAKCQLMLIGLDVENCLAIVINSHQHITHSMVDLCDLVQDLVHPVLRPEKESAGD